MRRHILLIATTCSVLITTIALTQDRSSVSARVSQTLDDVVCIDGKLWTTNKNETVFEMEKVCIENALQKRRS